MTLLMVGPRGDLLMVLWGGVIPPLVLCIVPFLHLIMLQYGMVLLSPPSSVIPKVVMVLMGLDVALPVEVVVVELDVEMLVEVVMVLSGGGGRGAGRGDARGGGDIGRGAGRGVVCGGGIDPGAGREVARQGGGDVGRGTGRGGARGDGGGAARADARVGGRDASRGGYTVASVAGVLDLVEVAVAHVYQRPVSHRPQEVMLVVKRLQTVVMALLQQLPTTRGEVDDEPKT
eukprot:jgi/Phyca11/18637/fgenesh1_pg.PHYCAscaffold_39_\